MAINKKNSIRTDISINSSGAQASITKLFDKIKRGQSDVSKGTKKATTGLGKMGSTAATAGKKGGAGMGFLSKGLKGAKAAVLSMIPALGGLTTAFAATGIGAIVIAAVALGAAFIGAIKTGAKFGKALSALKGISGATNEEMSALSTQAKNLGASTAFTASEVVKLQTELAKLGFEAGQIQQATPSILDLAASLEVDLASAAEFAGSVVRSFGLDASETQRVVDVMAASATGSAQSFGSLVESFKLAAPTARALGVSVEETGALLGALANNGLKGSIAGTGLSKVFIQLAKEGLTLDQGLDKVRNSSDKLNTAIDLVGVIGSKSLLTLAESGDDIDRLTGQLLAAEGAAQALAETKLDNLSGDVTKLGSAWEGFILGIEDGSGALNSLARGAIQLLTGAITGMTDLFFYLGFAWDDGWNQIKLRAEGGAKYISGQFSLLGGAIKLFANEAMLMLSKIPIIGEAIDESAVRANIDAAKEQLISAAAQIRQAQAKLDKANLNDATFMARLIEAKKGEAIAIQKAQDQKAADKKIEEDQEALIKRQEKDAKTLAGIKEKIAKQTADQEAVTDEEKLALKRERQLAELDDLYISAAEKQAVEKEINDLYDAKKAELDEKKKVEKEEKEAAAEALRLEKQLELDALELERLLQNDQLTYDERERLQLDYLEKKRLHEVSNEKLTKEQIELIDKKAEKAKKKVQDAEAKASKDLQDKVVNDALNGAAEAFGIAQEVAVAKMIMAAPEAISGSFKNAAMAYAPPMSQIMGALGAAGVVAPIIKGLGDIKKARFGKKGKSSGGGGGGGNISMPQVGGGGDMAGIASSAISDIAANNAARVGVDPSIGGAAGASAANNVMGGSSNNVTFSEGQYSDFTNQIAFRESLTSIGG
jgi:hypothetical protein